ncbi:MAG: hypothetical protein CVU39_28195 [Chloroflexi bacterium HGW-Chloroflexi-10]|nr:MAG: hypothetical protein CVU39_28195 [Chloroflexi bacterium HGW-Chloroflexi-10]
MRNAADTTFEKTRTKSTSYSRNSGRKMYQTDLYQQVIGFTCAHCKIYISSDFLLSGVQNRNHCPYCLWSKHVDLHQSGDRLCACKAPMCPVGLAFKRTRNKYGSGQGELMIIHRCTDCGGVSINRIAADDDNEKLLRLFDSSLHLDAAFRTQLKLEGIQTVHTEDLPLVRARLFGHE